MTWRQFVMNLDALDPGRVEAALSDWGALSVTFTNAGEDPVLEPPPGETPLWTDTKVTALFDVETSLDCLQAALQTALGISRLPDNHIEDLADRLWEREWLHDLAPMQFGRRLWVIPGDETPPDPLAINVRLDPGLAFGTGTHPTTALCLEWLERSDIEGKSVFDLGCGSGILSVAAAKLGADSILAVDIDLQAVTATRQNAARNDVNDGLTVSDFYDGSKGAFDIVVANILAGTLVDNVELIHDAVRPGGNIALSGILADQVGEVSDAFRQKFDLDEPVFLEEWALLSGTRN
ncbi:MAG: 50S ribosomal protein L11 methyltransferase [Gammaproteobacteria bacterium]|nr:50S ribosomal protein L11 methyltransferase [Gammaproteobacteria bacterium]